MLKDKDKGSTATVTKRNGKNTQVQSSNRKGRWTTCSFYVSWRILTTSPLKMPGNRQWTITFQHHVPVILTDNFVAWCKAAIHGSRTRSVVVSPPSCRNISSLNGILGLILEELSAFLGNRSHLCFVIGNWRQPLWTIFLSAKIFDSSLASNMILNPPPYNGGRRRSIKLYTKSSMTASIRACKAYLGSTCMRSCPMTETVKLWCPR